MAYVRQCTVHGIHIIGIRQLFDQTAQRIVDMVPTYHCTILWQVTFPDIQVMYDCRWFATSARYIYTCKKITTLCVCVCVIYISSVG